MRVQSPLTFGGYTLLRGVNEPRLVDYLTGNFGPHQKEYHSDWANYEAALQKSNEKFSEAVDAEIKRLQNGNPNHPVTAFSANEREKGALIVDGKEDIAAFLYELHTEEAKCVIRAREILQSGQRRADPQEIASRPAVAAYNAMSGIETRKGQPDYRGWGSYVVMRRYNPYKKGESGWVAEVPPAIVSQVKVIDVSV